MKTASTSNLHMSLEIVPLAVFLAPYTEQQTKIDKWQSSSIQTLINMLHHK